MKRIACLSLGALLALGTVACNGGEEVTPKGNETSTDTEKESSTDSDKKDAIAVYEECTPGVKDPCVSGAHCETIDIYDVSLCLKECETTADCGEYGVCGSDLNGGSLYAGYCIDEIPSYGLVFPILPAACADNQISTFGYGGAYYASNFYSDAGAQDALYTFGICAPLCGDATGTTFSNLPTTCPAVELSEEDDASWFEYDIFGLNGTEMECVKGTLSENLPDLGICGFVAGDYDICDDGAFVCNGVYDRKNAFDSDDYVGVACYPFGTLGVNMSEDKSTGLYKGYDVNGAAAIGRCIALCTKDDDCACANENDPMCKLGDKEARICYYGVNPDDSDDAIGGMCENITKCDTAADCPAYDGYKATCVDPADGYDYDNTHYEFTFTQKFCDYEETATN